MTKWLGLGGLLLGIVAFGVFGFLGLVWYEPPIEVPSVLSPGSRPGELSAAGFTGGEYWFEVAGLGEDAACTLVARRADGREVFREARTHVTESGCRGSGTPLLGESWTLTFTAERARVAPAAPGPIVKAYQSHGDGFPYITAILLACALVSAGGLLAFVVGAVRERRG